MIRTGIVSVFAMVMVVCAVIGLTLWLNPATVADQPLPRSTAGVLTPPLTSGPTLNP